MKHILLSVFILQFGTVFSQRTKTGDTTTSRTMIFAALNTRNSFYKRDEFDVMGKGNIGFTAITLKNIQTNGLYRGVLMRAERWTTGGISAYFDESEIEDIIKCLKYIIDNVDLEKKPGNDQWIYYKTVDDFEIGTKSVNGNKWKTYFKKNHLVLQDEEFTMSRKDLGDIYDSFVLVNDFLKQQNGK